MGLGPIISRYLIALAATGIAYGLYGSLIAPIIEGTPQPVIPKTPEHINSRPGLEIRSEIRSLFPKDAWEVNPCKILETRQGKILFQDYHPRDDGSVELKPLSMVIQPSAPKEHSDGSEIPPPIVLRAPEGAVLRFENPLTLTGDIGKLQRGQFIGEVQIYRKASSAEKDDSFSLVTQNIQISSERIFTLYETSFRFGKSYGRGNIWRSTSPVHSKFRMAARLLQEFKESN